MLKVKTIILNKSISLLCRLPRLTRGFPSRVCLLVEKNGSFASPTRGLLEADSFIAAKTQPKLRYIVPKIDAKTAKKPFTPGRRSTGFAMTNNTGAAQPSRKRTA